MGKLTAAILLSVVAAEHRREKPRVSNDEALLAHLAGNTPALVTGNILPAAQPLGGESLLLLDVLGDVGEGSQALSQSNGPAGEKQGQRSTDQEEYQGLPEGGCIYHGEDYSDANENDASNPDDDQHRRPEPERSVASAHLLLLPYTACSTPNEAQPSAGGRRASGETDAGISHPHRKPSTPRSPRERTGV